MRVAVSRHVPSWTGLDPEAGRADALCAGLDIGVEELPAPAWDEARHARMLEVEVVCGALNFRDLNTAYEGLLGIRGKPATVFGSEIAGVVRRVGRGVEGIRVGERVVTIAQGRCGRCRHCQESGDADICEMHGPGTSHGFMEHVMVPAHGVRAFDSRLSFLDAAAYSFSACMAYDLIHRRLELQPSEIIVITAANSGLGAYATQFAVNLGARVVALVRSDALAAKCYRQKVLAAYKFDRLTPVESLRRRVRRDCRGAPVDCVLDLAADVYGGLSLELLGRGGRYVACGLAGLENPSLRFPWRRLIEKEISAQGAGYNPAETFEPCMRLLAEGRAEPLVDSVYPVEQLTEACARAWCSGERYGKVLLRFKDENICRATATSVG